MEALSAEERAKKMMEGVPDLPPLLAGALRVLPAVGGSVGTLSGTCSRVGGA